MGAKAWHTYPYETEKWLRLYAPSLARKTIPCNFTQVYPAIHIAPGSTAVKTLSSCLKIKFKSLLGGRRYTGGKYTTPNPCVSKFWAGWRMVEEDTGSGVGRAKT